MNTSRFLLAAVAGFVLFVAALSFYMSGDAVPAPPGPIPAATAGAAEEDVDSPRTSMREEFALLRRTREEARERQILADQTPPRRRQRPSPWRQQLERMGEQLDEAAARWRSNLADAATAKLLAGAAEMQSGQPAAAVEQFDRVLAKAPTDVTALSAKAAALVAAKRFVEAAEVYAELVRLAPEDAAAGYNYGVVLYRLGRYGEAADQFSRVVRVDRRHAPAWYNLATLAQRAGRLAEARDAWRAFLELRPEVASGWFNLGVVWMDFDEPMEAAACFSLAADLKPGDRDGHLNLGLAYAAAGHWTAALEAMNRADAVSPCDPLVMGCLAQLHAALAELGGPGAGAHRRLALELQSDLADER